jgi:hypothetical protein
MATTTQAVMAGTKLPGTVISASTTVLFLTQMAAVPSKIVLLYYHT